MVLTSFFPTFLFQPTSMAGPTKFLIEAGYVLRSESAGSSRRRMPRGESPPDVGPFRLENDLPEGEANLQLHDFAGRPD